MELSGNEYNGSWWWLMTMMTVNMFVTVNGSVVWGDLIRTFLSNNAMISSQTFKILIAH